MPIGKLICLEGGEGAGKTTVFARLKGHLPESQYAFFREPGGTLFGEELRSVIFAYPNISSEAQLLLFMASRLHIFQTEIRPALGRGVHVVTDRMDASTFAYQVFGTPGGIEAVFNELRRIYLAPIGDSDWLKPVYLFLDTPPEIGLARARERAGNTYDAKSLEYHTRVYEGYKHFIPLHEHRVVDATRDPDLVFEDVLAHVRSITS